MPLRAITLDLDDTLWPFEPVARRIETALSDWLAEHAPDAAIHYSREHTLETMAQLRDQRPDIAHDVGALRHIAMQRLLGLAGDPDPRLVEAAVAVASTARQQVDLYPETARALDRLAARVPLLALTNGNADLGLTGVAHWFSGHVSPVDAGVSKPDARIFGFACQRLQLAPADVLHVGDNLEIDIDGALAAGMQAAWLQRDQDGEAPLGALRFRDLDELADFVTANGG